MGTFVNSLQYAGNGLKYFILAERNGKIHLIITALVLAACGWFKVTVTEWCIVLLCIGFVIGLEMINTGIERLCDMVSKDYHPTIKIIKDVAAGAVLMASIVSLIIGVIIFIPYLQKM